MNKLDEMLNVNGGTVNYNLTDAIEVLTEEEAVMLDMLVSKVKNYTEEKEAMELHAKNHLVYTIAQQNGMTIEEASNFVELLENTNGAQRIVLIKQIQTPVSEETEEAVVSSDIQTMVDMLLSKGFQTEFKPFPLCFKL